MGHSTRKLWLRCWLVVLGAIPIATAAAAVPTVLQIGIPTIDLDRGSVPGTVQSPTAIAYHPDLNQYYGANGGNTSYDGFTWGASGGDPLDALSRRDPPDEIGVDARTVYYNPNEDQIEIVASPGPGLDHTIMAMDLDGGFFTGLSSTIMLSGSGGGPLLLTGVDSLSSPAFDPGRDVFYARGIDSNETTIQVVSRSTGQPVMQTDPACPNPTSSPSSGVACTITTDLPTGTSIQRGWIGYDANFDVLVTIDAANELALIHGLDGSLIDQSDIAGFFNPTQTFLNAGYANRQLFVFDKDANTWHGLRVLAPEPTTALLFGAGCLGLASRRGRRRA